MLLEEEITGKKSSKNTCMTPRISFEPNSDLPNEKTLKAWTQFNLTESHQQRTAAAQGPCTGEEASSRVETDLRETDLFELFVSECDWSLTDALIRPWWVVIRVLMYNVTLD